MIFGYNISNSCLKIENAAAKTGGETGEKGEEKKRNSGPISVQNGEKSGKNQGILYIWTGFFGGLSSKCLKNVALVW